MSEANEVILRTDGSVSPDGHGGWGYEAVNGTIKHAWGRLTRATSTQAEMFAALQGLRDQPDGSSVFVRTDCVAVVDAINGKGRCEGFIKAFAREAERLRLTVKKVPRQSVEVAHVLANKGRLER